MILHLSLGHSLSVSFSNPLVSPTSQWECSGAQFSPLPTTVSTPCLGDLTWVQGSKYHMPMTLKYVSIAQTSQICSPSCLLDIATWILRGISNFLSSMPYICTLPVVFPNHRKWQLHPSCCSAQNPEVRFDSLLFLIHYTHPISRY